MTIIAALMKPRFSVLAADRLWYAIEDDGSYRNGEYSKLIVHDRYPVAIALAGIAALPPVERPRHVHDVLAELLQQLSPDRVSFAKLFPWLVEKLHDHVKEVVPHASRNMPPPKLDLWTAIGPDVRLLRLTLDVQNGRLDRARLEAPDSLERFYQTGRYAESPSPIFCEGVDAPDDVALEVLRCVHEGVEEEARISGGRPTCGGGVDVALIDSTGTRRWKPL